ncbi:MAG: phosphatase PAP2 family protein, partial [Bacteroidota bacterium]
MDQSLFEFFHFTLANDFFDWLLPYWRKRETWIPLYVLLAAYMLWRDWRRGLATLLAVIVAVALADFITSGLLKPWVGRIRPCATPELAGQLRELVSCGGSLSFPSSHASNHLAIALVLGWSGVLSPPNLPEGEGLISPPPSGELEGDKSSGELEGDKSSGELEGDKSSGELEGD